MLPGDSDIVDNDRGDSKLVDNDYGGSDIVDNAYSVDIGRLLLGECDCSRV